MNKPKLILHIGTHKTGSSLIQAALIKHSSQLKKENIIVLPDFEFAHELMKVKTYDDKYVQLGKQYLRGILPKKIKTKNYTFVMSFEGFSGNPLEGYSNSMIIAQILHEIFTDFSTTIVVYLRRQDQFIESLYTQQIHNGGSQSFKEFLSVIKKVTFNWHLLVENYATFFEKRNIIVKLYDHKYINKNNALINDFAKIIGAKCIKNFESKSSQNYGYSRDALELARICNPYLSEEEKYILRKILQSSNSKKPFEKYEFFNTEERNKLLSRYEPSNRLVFSIYLNNLKTFSSSIDKSENSKYSELDFKKFVIVFMKMYIKANQNEQELLTIKYLHWFERIIKKVKKDILIFLDNNYVFFKQ